jgi:hypothetical protein
VALGLGTGLGVHGRRELELHDRSVRAGLTPSSWGHALPELGYRVTEDLAISLQGRHQVIPESGTADVAGRPARSAHALLARAQWTAKRRGRGALLLTGAVGGGHGFRLVVAPQPNVRLYRNDTVRGGPVIAGPGVAWSHRFTERLVATVELRALAGFPDLAGVLDLGAGASYAF